jgi:hypothetical protein
MPCSDGGVPYPKSRLEQLDDLAPAMLCGLFHANEAVFLLLLEGIDEKECGVTKHQVREWIALHEEKDAQRRKGERALEYFKRVREKALSKLTLEEKLALSLRKK